MNVFYTRDYSDKECRELLEKLYGGHMVVLPTGMDHARHMIRVAQCYMNQHHQQTFDALKADYS